MSDDPDRLLRILRSLILSEVRLDQRDLTARQLAITMTVYQTDELQTVRGLAEYLNIGKPVVTRSLDRLGEVDFVRRELDPRDRRSVIVVRTKAGAMMLARLKAAAAANPGEPEGLTISADRPARTPRQRPRTRHPLPRLER